MNLIYKCSVIIIISYANQLRTVSMPVHLFKQFDAYVYPIYGSVCTPCRVFL